MPLWEQWGAWIAVKLISQHSNTYGGLDVHRSQMHCVVYWTVIVVASLVCLAMTLLTTAKEDDMWLALIDGQGIPIRSVTDWLHSHFNHWHLTNGRTADLIASAFAVLLNKPAFAVANALVFAVMLHGVSLAATSGRSLLAVAVTLAVIGRWYPVPGETMLWLAGSCNYLWAIAASLPLLIWLQRHTHGQDRYRLSPWLMGLVATVAGSMNEATSLGVLGGMVIYCMLNHRQVDRTVVFTLVGYALGTAIIIASPAAWNRAAGGGIALHLDTQQLLSSRLYIFWEKCRNYVTPLTALAVGGAALVVGGWSSWRHNVWTWVTLCLTALMLALGLHQDRAYAAWATATLIVTVMGLAPLLHRLRWVRWVVIAVSLLLATREGYRGARAIYDYYLHYNHLVSQVQQAGDEAVVRGARYKGYSRFVRPVSFMSTDFFTHEYAWCHYYDKSNVQFLPDSAFNRYRSGRLLDDATMLPFTSKPPHQADTLLAIEGQDYAVVLWQGEQPPYSTQQARYYLHDDHQLSDRETQRRYHYGLASDYSPHGFAPVRYQGRWVIITATVEQGIDSIVLPMGNDHEEVVLIRQSR